MRAMEFGRGLCQLLPTWQLLCLPDGHRDSGDSEAVSDSLAQSDAQPCTSVQASPADRHCRPSLSAIGTTAIVISVWWSMVSGGSVDDIT